MVYYNNLAQHDKCSIIFLNHFILLFKLWPSKSTYICTIVHNSIQRCIMGIKNKLNKRNVISVQQHSKFSFFLFMLNIINIYFYCYSFMQIGCLFVPLLGEQNRHSLCTRNIKYLNRKVHTTQYSISFLPTGQLALWNSWLYGTVGSMEQLALWNSWLY